MTQRKLLLKTGLILTGGLTCYIYQMSPSPLLSVLGNYFGVLHNDVLLNLLVSVIMPVLIIASVAGGILGEKIATWKLYLLALTLLAIGTLINFLGPNYNVFLLGRICYATGMGFSLPFIGAAIMKWYTPSQRVFMNTANSLFPFVGTIISFSSLTPLYIFFNNSWQYALGLWGFIFAGTAIIWYLTERNDSSQKEARTPQETQTSQQGLSIYLALLKRHDIRLLCITFMCDFISYSYLAVILPTYFLEAGHLDEVSAGIIAALAFPGCGIIGCVSGSIFTSLTGRRKFIMALGQLLKFAGIVLATILADGSTSRIILGVALFGLGTSMWQPGMYSIPMELDQMTPIEVGASFSLMSSCGFLMGFIVPLTGGFFTDVLMNISGIANPSLAHAFGLKWSMLLFGLPNLIGFVCVLFLQHGNPPGKICT